MKKCIDPSSAKKIYPFDGLLAGQSRHSTRNTIRSVCPFEYHYNAGANDQDLGRAASMKEKYINLFTDFGFQKVFGEEASKEHLISFLNTLLPEHHQIQELQFCNNEYQGASALDRKAIFDLNCVSATGEFFIVELQKAKQNFFKDRSVFYATFPIQQQAQRGDWNFKLYHWYFGLRL